MDGVAAPAEPRRSRPRFGRTELVLAVACVGVLAAAAVPRQWSLSAGIRRTEVVALARSLRSAAQLGHSLWLSAGAPAALEVARGHVTIINGYPAAADLPLLVEESETLAFHHEEGAWQHRDAERCGLRYAPPARRG